MSELAVCGVGRSEEDRECPGGVLIVEEDVGSFKSPVTSRSTQEQSLRAKDIHSRIDSAVRKVGRDWEEGFVRV